MNLIKNNHFIPHAFTRSFTKLSVLLQFHRMACLLPHKTDYTVNHVQHKNYYEQYNEMCEAW